MKPEIIFIHGAGIQEPKSESAALLSTIKRKLNKRFLIHSPLMPDPSNPDCQTWMDHLDAIIHKLHGPITLIGHSLGGSVIVKYLSEHTVESDIEAVHLLAAPFWGREGWKSDEFFLSKANVPRLKQFDNLHFYQCEDDTVVPPNHLNHYMEMIPHLEAHRLQYGGHYFNEGIDELIENVILSNKQVTLN